MKGIHSSVTQYLKSLPEGQIFPGSLCLAGPSNHRSFCSHCFHSKYCCDQKAEELFPKLHVGSQNSPRAKAARAQGKQTVWPAQDRGGPVQGHQTVWQQEREEVPAPRADGFPCNAFIPSGLKKAMKSTATGRARRPRLPSAFAAVTRAPPCTRPSPCHRSTSPS